MATTPRGPDALQPSGNYTPQSWEDFTVYTCRKEAEISYRRMARQGWGYTIAWADVEAFALYLFNSADPMYKELIAECTAWREDLIRNGTAPAPAIRALWLIANEEMARQERLGRNRATGDTVPDEDDILA